MIGSLLMSKFPDISNLKDKLMKEINDIKSLDQLDNIRVSALGKKGAVTSLLKISHHKQLRFVKILVNR